MSWETLVFKVQGEIVSLTNPHNGEGGEQHFVVEVDDGNDTFEIYLPKKLFKRLDIGDNVRLNVTLKWINKEAV